MLKEETKNFFAVGITGHRKLSQEQILQATQAVKDFFVGIKEEQADREIVLLSSLAEGTDMLCAKLGLDFECCLLAVLPMNASEYRKDFSGAAAEAFDCLLSMADRVMIAMPVETPPEVPVRGFYYRQAAIQVVKNCDILLAVWNGEVKETSDGAGTWETMKLAESYGKKVQVVRV